MAYHIFTDATADFSMKMMNDLPEVTVFPMDVILDSTLYTYGPRGNISVWEFYNEQAQRKICKHFPN